MYLNIKNNNLLLCISDLPSNFPDTLLEEILKLFGKYQHYKRPADVNGSSCNFCFVLYFNIDSVIKCIKIIETVDIGGLKLKAHHDDLNNILNIISNISSNNTILDENTNIYRKAADIDTQDLKRINKRISEIFSVYFRIIKRDKTIRNFIEENCIKNEKSSSIKQSNFVNLENEWLKEEQEIRNKCIWTIQNQPTKKIKEIEEENYNYYLTYDDDNTDN
ncbi:hypothetical protein CWI37_0423p0020 [Hamiltosporidium tvaerminnensis]|uniref:RRM domain-containing protein n=1 Tax=Hamiltosporidium tvaerminnensis TaxID=1176355 RepID=A0A4Q9L6C8_9MICR|nr:hypothetical protein LUQ84_002245 [Hamiltosporidium tvaerminnensis]TBU02735.1 hypothetical protein CWI37_0423p0020 [Hamiltosporidium tvaerminnensis]